MNKLLHPALAENALQVENEKLRGLLTEILDSINGGGRVITFTDDDIDEIKAALAAKESVCLCDGHGYSVVPNSPV